MRFLTFFFAILYFPLAISAGYSNVGGKWTPERYTPYFSVQEHYDRGCQELNKCNWEEALVNFMVITYHFTQSPFYQDALFYTGVCYFNLGEYDLANKQFDRYLAIGGKLKHFEKAFDYKLDIANFFSAGTKKHLFGVGKLPKWAPAKRDALAIYDEIIAALPAKEIAAQALFNKALLLKSKRQYKESIETLQSLSRRFPRHSLSADSYVTISEIYLEQSRLEAQNPDFIALAQLNIQRFLKTFPMEGRVEQARKNLFAMQEVYAQSLFDTGRFYERKKKPDASMIYYEDAIRKYPGTRAAAKSEERLARLSTSRKR